MDATLVTLAYITGIALVVLFVAVALWLRRLIADRRDGWQADKHEGATEDSPALAVKAKESALVIARSPLLDRVDAEWAEQAGRLADEIAGRMTRQERLIYGAGRHRAAGVRDPRRFDLDRPTEAFEIIAENETGHRPLELGPREVDLRPQRLVWDPSQPDVWRQESLLEIEVGK
jgi:hypothetical protein